MLELLLDLHPLANLKSRKTKNFQLALQLLQLLHDILSLFGISLISCEVLVDVLACRSDLC